MRIVFDTNVLIAALITAEGVCGNLVKRCAQVHTPIAAQPRVQPAPPRPG